MLGQYRVGEHALTRGQRTELAIERSMDTEREVPIDAKLLEEARLDTPPSARAWLETARNYAVYANEGGSYDELLAYLKRTGIA